jgi:hypothetical protein
MKSSPSQQHQFKKWVQIGGTLISSILFIWLLTQQNWELVILNLSQLPLWVIPAAFGLIFSGYLANTLRWHILLHSQNIDPGYWTTFKIVLSGAFASNFLPSTIGGDALRIVGILHHTNKSAIAVSSVFLDRVLNILSMLFLLPIAWFVFFFNGNTILANPLLRPYNGMTITWIQSLYMKAKLKLIIPLIESSRVWMKYPAAIIEGLLVSWLSLFVVFLGVWTLARGIRIPVAFYEVIAISTVVYVLTLIPISINGYGLREIAVTALYVRLGATLEQASTLALITRFLALVATLPGAFWVSEVLTGPHNSKRSNEDQNDPSY